MEAPAQDDLLRRVMAAAEGRTRSSRDDDDRWAYAGRRFPS